MKTLCLLRNLAALFILGAALMVSRPSVGLAASQHGHCVPTSLAVNCAKSGDHQCVTIPCFFPNNCGHKECVF